MAALCTDKNGNRTLQFTLDGRRPKIHLGKMTKRQAEAIKLRVEHLVAARIAGTAPDDETSRWVAALSDDFAARLADLGLTAPRIEKPKEQTALGEFLDSYLESRHFKKPNTERNYRTTARRMLDYFSRSVLLNAVSAGDAEEWRESLTKSGLSEVTVCREVRRAKQFMSFAVKKRLLSENPFLGLKSSKQTNKERMEYVEASIVEQVIAACPDVSWRVIVALARYAVLRCPSEVLSLKWEHIDWERERMSVPSPKTECHGRSSRLVPIFPELRPYLRDAFELAPDGAVYVAGRFGGQADRNLATRLAAIIRRAGVTPWQKTFANLRSSCQTDQTNAYPIQAVCAWIGNSVDVAKEHYLQVTEAHFQAAVQNRVQHAAAGGCTGTQDVGPQESQMPVEQPVATMCQAVQDEPVPRRGVEPLSPP